MSLSLSRRKLLQAGVGVGQMALLAGLGLRPKAARALGEGGPTRLLTLYVHGGWKPELFFTPLNAAEIAMAVPGRTSYLGEPCFFDPNEVSNLDGSGDEPDADDPSFKRMRAAHQWDAEALAAGQVIEQNGLVTPLGWSWMHNELFSRACMIHGVDVGTAAHHSARISMLCGVPGPTFRSPALHAFVADALASAFPHRPLQSVAIGQGPEPVSSHLGPAATPTRIMSLSSLEATLSERSGAAWDGLRDRSPHPQYAFHGGPIAQPIDTNGVDEFVLAQSRRLYGSVNSGTNRFYEDFYETYKIVSKQLALDLVTGLESASGWEHFDPTWARPRGQPPYGVNFGPANGSDAGGMWADSFNLALKLLKTDTCSALSLKLPSIDDFYFDTHDGRIGAQLNYIHGRVVFEIAGRLLHEMSLTPVSGGKTLLDDTLVMVYSEFSRTWYGGDDHWPSTSVLLAGGGIRGNRQIGGFEVLGAGYSPVGLPIPMRNEGGGNDVITRMPKSADIIYTVLQLLGIENVFIPGGVAEILGVRA